VAVLTPHALLLGPRLLEEEEAHLGVTEPVERRLVAGLAHLGPDVGVRRAGRHESRVVWAGGTPARSQRDHEKEDGREEQSGSEK
jgi:hypothetical protein